ncbi:MAG: GNAT family N-acetyltransferase [Magnetococcales bacterium]|nr:GNAT family N-acetyltransferase [Magnetococcales bacterium]
MDNSWMERWADKITTPQEAVKKVRSGQRVFLGSGCGVPNALVEALVQRAKKLADVEIIHVLSLGNASYTHEKVQNTFSVNSFFISDNVRQVIQQGLGDYTPIYLSDIPELFSSGQLPIDVAMVQVSPPDNDGMVSLGVSVNVNTSAINSADLVIAQVNPLMPRTLGGALLHVESLDLMVFVEEPIAEVFQPLASNAIKRIGSQVAALVESDSTIEVGIGLASQAVWPYLKHKTGLKIHTEMISDAILPLIESGAIHTADKEEKTIISSFALGTRRLYDAIDNNPAFSFESTEFVNNPARISGYPKMIAINTALEVDLTGQVCADSLGENFYSGLGGLVDFNIGASHSEGGKAIIVLPSTAKNGSISRITCQLSQGSGVAITRGGIHYVVTEFGVAYLHGKSIQERAVALISVAHPDFRSQLMKAAIKARYLRKEMSEVEGMVFVGPQALKATMELPDKQKIIFRPSHPSDKRAIKEMLYSLSNESIYKRFISHVEQFPFQRIKNFLYVDHRGDEVVVGVIPKKKKGEKIVCVAGYYLDPTSNRAEIAFMVSDDWQGKGLARFSLQLLITAAIRNGLRGFTAETLPSNTSMRHVFEKSGLKVSSRMEDGMLFYQMDF